MKGLAFRYRPTGDSKEHTIRVVRIRKNMKSLRGLRVWRCDVLILDSNGCEVGTQRTPLEVGDEALAVLPRVPEHDKGESE